MTEQRCGTCRLLDHDTKIVVNSKKYFRCTVTLPAWWDDLAEILEGDDVYWGYVRKEFGEHCPCYKQREKQI